MKVQDVIDAARERGCSFSREGGKGFSLLTTPTGLRIKVTSRSGGENAGTVNDLLRQLRRAGIDIPKR